MADRTLELRAILDSAERAAAAQDFASAAEFLRRAATLQETEYGSQHPDLANTFNNLGIVYEGLGQPADAEASYRKAYAIATATLPASDPLVVTSRENLRDFCAASGRPFNLEPGAPSRLETNPSAYGPGELDFASERDFAPEPIPSDLPLRPPVPVEPPAPVPLSKPSAGSKPIPPVPEAVTAKPPALNDVPVVAPVATASPSRNRSMTWLVVAAGLILTFVIVFAGPWSGSDDSASTETPAPASPPPAPAQPATAPPVTADAAPPPTPAPAPAPVAADPGVAEKISPPVESKSRPPAPAAGGRSAPATTASVADARLCRTRSTSNWRCTDATTPANPGVFFFYTRVKSARATTVEHRWYQDGTLRRTVNLRIAANPSEGYRTYSRNTVTAERRGEWRVELRDAEGALLHEERLVVR